jgi:hypothetical protein
MSKKVRLEFENERVLEVNHIPNDAHFSIGATTLIIVGPAEQLYQDGELLMFNQIPIDLEYLFGDQEDSSRRRRINHVRVRWKTLLNWWEGKSVPESLKLGGPDLDVRWQREVTLVRKTRSIQVSLASLPKAQVCENARFIYVKLGRQNVAFDKEKGVLSYNNRPVVWHKLFFNCLQNQRELGWYDFGRRCQRTVNDYNSCRMLHMKFTNIKNAKIVRAMNYSLIKTDNNVLLLHGLKLTLNGEPIAGVDVADDGSIAWDKLLRDGVELASMSAQDDSSERSQVFEEIDLAASSSSTMLRTSMGESTQVGRPARSMSTEIAVSLFALVSSASKSTKAASRENSMEASASCGWSEEIASQDKCVLCLGQKLVCLLPCAHAHACKECYERYEQDLDPCPLCRENKLLSN